MGEEFFFEAISIPGRAWPDDIKNQVIWVGFWAILVVLTFVKSRKDPKYKIWNLFKKRNSEK